jgi:hypothetical protein
LFFEIFLNLILCDITYLPVADTIEECLDVRLAEFGSAFSTEDAFVQHEPKQESESHNVIYVGELA